MPIDQVYFVQEGMVSLVQPLENGAMIEVGMIGSEGFLGVPVLLGADSSPLKQWFRFLVQPYGCQQVHSAGSGPKHRPFGTAASVCPGTPHSGLIFGGMQRATHAARALSPLVADRP